MAVVSRLELDHPALGTTGGSGLHASIEAIYTKIGNNLADRLFYVENLADAATADLDHNFGTDLSNLRYDVYLWDTGTQVLTLITNSSSPARSAFPIIERPSFEYTQARLTNSSGAERDLVVMFYHDPIELLGNDIKDVDNTTAIEDGQTLVYDSNSGKLKPGASGDASFKVQSVTDPNAVIKGGYILLDDGRELATYDGAGGASTDYGVDITVSLDTILGSNPADATTYYLYIDLTTLGSEQTLSDNGRKVYAIEEAQLALLTTAPSATDLSIYVPLNFIRSATTGTVWSGTGSAFGTTAFRMAPSQVLTPNATASTPGFYVAGQAPGQDTGAAIGAGFIGEIINGGAASTTANDGGGGNAYKDVSGATLQLTAGIWMIHATGNMRVASGVVLASAYFGIFTSTNVFLTQTGGRIQDNQMLTASASVIVNISATTNYKLRMITNTNTANEVFFETSSQSVQNDEHYKFYAVRIA